MDDNLVGYLLQALDEDTQQQVEGYLRDYPDARRRLELLRRALEPLAADREDIAPPPGLAFRALALVAEYRCRPLPEPPPPPLPAGLGPGRSWWRRADLLVAACILIVLGGLTTQGLVTYRRHHDRLACANNLRQFHQALVTYSHLHNGHFPGVPLEPRDPDIPRQPWHGHARYNVAGIFLAELNEHGCTTSEMSVRCPANNGRHLPKHTLRDLHQMSPAEFEQVQHILAGCYAYSLGYRDPVDGQLRPLRRDWHHPALNFDWLPIMADCPSLQEDGGRHNSANHGGGQNVLFVGGHVSFHTTPHLIYATRDGTVEHDHIYLNREGKVGAGIGRLDSCLGLSADRP